MSPEPGLEVALCKTILVGPRPYPAPDITEGLVGVIKMYTPRGWYNFGASEYIVDVVFKPIFLDTWSFVAFVAEIMGKADDVGR